MNIVPHAIKTTNDLLTSQAGITALAEIMQHLNLAELIDQHFPLGKSNRAFKPSVFIETFIIMQHQGNFRLCNVKILENDQVLKTLLGLKNIPKETSLGEWLRRNGSDELSFSAWVKVNQQILKVALHKLKGITLDIDATEIIADKNGAKFTYKKNKGYMPMVGHIAETGHVVTVDFREGNASPARENLEFIQQCERALPAGCFVKNLRIDCAGYQAKIIEYCDKKGISYAIRAKQSNVIKDKIAESKPEDWQPLLDKEEQVVKYQHTLRTIHCISTYEEAFTLIIQRKEVEVKGQAELDFDDELEADEVKVGRYIYRSIATNRDKMSDSDIVNFYNQRAEDSENRIKELKLDFGGDTLPCTDFGANRLYFMIAALSYNIFALMKLMLPESLSRHRVITIRKKLYTMAGKLVRSGRQWTLKVVGENAEFLINIKNSLTNFRMPEI
jgi:hypothetical protein